MIRITQDVADDVSPLTGNITVRNLDFSYNRDFNVLSGISFDIKQRSTVGVVGRTGSGKSTLLSILSGIYSVKRGSVLNAVNVETEVYPGFPTDVQAQWMTLMTQANESSTIVARA